MAQQPVVHSLSSAAQTALKQAAQLQDVAEFAESMSTAFSPVLKAHYHSVRHSDVTNSQQAQDDRILLLVHAQAVKPVRSKSQARKVKAWSCVAFAMLQPSSTSQPARRLGIDTYVLLDLKPWGPTKAVQEGLMQVRWQEYGLEASQASVGSILGQGQITFKDLTNQEMMTGTMQLWALILSITCQAADNTADTAEEQGSQACAPVQAPTPGHVITRSMVAEAVSQALAIAKQTAQGAWGASRTEARVEPLLPLLTHCLLDIIRSAHSPVLLPFSCSVLQCMESELPATLLQRVQGSFRQGMDELRSRQQTARAAAAAAAKAATANIADTAVSSSQPVPVSSSSQLDMDDDPMPGGTDPHSVHDMAMHDLAAENPATLLQLSQPTHTEAVARLGAWTPADGDWEASLPGNDTVVQLPVATALGGGAAAGGAGVGSKAAGGQDLHATLQALYGIKPVKRSRMQPDSGSSAWLF